MLMLLVLVTGESHGMAVRAESGPRSAPIPVFPRAEGGAQDRDTVGERLISAGYRTC